MFRFLSAHLKARPRAGAALGLLIVAGAVAGGWAASEHGRTDAVLTSGKIAADVPAPPPPPPPADLQASLEELAAGFREDVGLAVTDVATGWTAQVHGEIPYPQQSVSKLWVALATLEAVDRGQSNLERVVQLGPDDRSVFYQPLGRRIRNSGGPEVSIAELLRWAITESDNAANDKLMRELGGADAVTSILAEKGLSDLKVGAYERDLQAAIAGMTWRPEYGIDWAFQHARAKLPDDYREQKLEAYLADPMDGAAPAEITRTLAALYKGELLSPASTKVMIGLLNDCRTGPMRLKYGFPPGWTLGHKTGTGQDFGGASTGINDVGLVTAPDGRVYAVAVMMRKTSKSIPARQAFFHKVSRALAAHWQAQQRPADRQVAVVPAPPAGGE
ncbi:class A beta-lactamase [Phenylobacterium sp. J367]|uniref:class A beta-lactamase n=1 Tax=Phenylobacterium sp. J367 TaxID=2898435 RepID=UPI002150D098|nr:class A beta-lactamase [Phenylobacterium sp. J367]MCR5877835.1 class A beta-lactamase [Phenylobacterium sp. J367]